MTVHTSRAGNVVITTGIELEPDPLIPFVPDEHDIAGDEAKAEGILIRSVEMNSTGAKDALTKWRNQRTAEREAREAIRAKRAAWHRAQGGQAP